MVQAYTAREVALRYAEDEKFAEEFERELAAVYREQLRRLERIAVRAGVASKAEALPLARVPFAGLAPRTEASLGLAQLKAVLEEAPAGRGMTRGEIAKALGIDNRDAALTRALKTLKDSGELTQKGQRRSARYALASAARGKASARRLTKT